MYKYTKSWFINSEINKKLLHIIDCNKENKILEIGCYEGLSSVFFADNLLNHDKSLLVCIDPFLQIDNNDHGHLLQNHEEENFDYNISVCSNADKIQINKITSDDFFKFNNQTFNIIYIDGCHLPDFITRDMENSFNVLEKDGIMWMDDYGGGEDDSIKNTMNQFLMKYDGMYKLIHSGYQLAIQKL